MKEKKLYQVHFFEAVDGRNDYFFTTLRAIFHMFDSVTVGCSVYTLENRPPHESEPKATKKCIIYSRKITIPDKIRKFAAKRNDT